VRIRQTVTVLDAADIDAESSFWSRVLGGTVEAESDWHTISVDGHPQIAIQLAPDHAPPQWPNGSPQQLHLDLYVDDIEASHREVIDCGATVLQGADMTKARGFQVYADPAGHPFCLCWG
jgi:predicted enzyme related to lactoylglutathione lyase